MADLGYLHRKREDFGLVGTDAVVGTYWGQPYGGKVNSGSYILIKEMDKGGVDVD